MPSVGRSKFLVAGKSGLNLTNAAEFDTFAAQYSGSGFPRSNGGLWPILITIHWGGAEGLGVETFVASSGKVFPVEKKGCAFVAPVGLAPTDLGVQFRMRHRWTGLSYGKPIDLSSSHHGGACKRDL